MPTELGRSTEELAWSDKLDVSNHEAELQGMSRARFRTCWRAPWPMRLWIQRRQEFSEIPVESSHPATIDDQVVTGHVIGQI